MVFTNRRGCYTLLQRILIRGYNKIDLHPSDKYLADMVLCNRQQMLATYDLNNLLDI